MKFSKFISTFFIILSLVIISIPSQPVQAASFMAGSAAALINAINTANANGVDDVITLTADITLDAIDHFVTQNNLPNGATGLPDITSKITIMGNGHTIQRDLSFSSCDSTPNTTQDFRIFYVATDGDLTLSDITIRNGCGYHETTAGGGVYVYQGKLSIINTTFLENISGQGGAILNSVGTVTISGSTFSKNSAATGGAIYNFVGTTAISNSTFTKNTAIYLDVGRGGAIYNSFGTITLIENSTFFKNSADGGGAITNVDFGAINKIKNSTFSENSATEYGGAIDNCTSISLGATITSIENSTFSGNSAEENGGAIFNSPGGPYGTVICTIGAITNTTFSGNKLSASAAGSGAGIANENAITTITNTFVANSSDGDNCEGSIPAGSGNMDDDNTCDPGTAWETITPGTDYSTTLANNGGPTQTHALLSGGTAIDQVDCDNAYTTDQRGANRENDITGTGNDGSNYCDVGAFEYTGDDTPLTVTSSVPANNSTIENISELLITYSKNTLSDSSTNAANNTLNYLLVSKGANAHFDTQSCSAGLAGDDTEFNVNSANYNSSTYEVTLGINSGTDLPGGDYRLFVCGTTSVHDLVGLELNGGLSDATIDFTVPTAATASSLPETGFRHGQVTQLAQQPPVKAYTDTAMTLEIPKLGVSMPIIGVAQSGESWDVTWLGNSAGYLYGSAFPTWAGNTVITGHVWDAYNRPGAFAEIKSLKYGDQVQIQAWGATYTYEVRESKLVTQKNTNAVFQSEQYDWVTLVTCEFYNPFSGEYLFRRAVRAVLVSVQ